MCRLIPDNGVKSELLFSGLSGVIVHTHLVVVGCSDKDNGTFFWYVPRPSRSNLAEEDVADEPPSVDERVIGNVISRHGGDQSGSWCLFKLLE